MNLDRHLLGRLSIALCVAVVLACSWLRPLDERANAKVSDGLQKALVTYGTARALHGGVSVLQGTQVNAEPAGVGLTFSPGQILAPAAEMLKQFSDVMLFVCVAFGIQRLLIGIASHWFVSAALTITALAWAWQLVGERRPQAWLTNAFIVLLLIQFSVPVTILGSDHLFQRFLNEGYQEAQRAISPIASRAATPSQPIPADAEKPGMLDRLKDWAHQKSTSTVAEYESLKKTVEQTTAHIIRLLAVFLLQTVILPLTLLWALYACTRAALRLPGGRSSVETKS
jgi:hypothetical protein